MESGSVRPLGPDTVAVPAILWQQIESLIPQMSNVLSRLDLLESTSVTGSEYLTRQQAMSFLHIGSTKLWELKNAGELKTSSATGKPLYSTDSCRQYLESQGYSKEAVQARFREILAKKRKK